MGWSHGGGVQKSYDGDLDVYSMLWLLPWSCLKAGLL